MPGLAPVSYPARCNAYLIWLSGWTQNWEEIEVYFSFIVFIVARIELLY